MPTSTVGPFAPTCTACCVPEPAFAQKLCQCAPKLATEPGSLKPEKCRYTPTPTRLSSASTLAEVNTFCTAAPSLTPRVLVKVSSVMITMAARFAVFSPKLPDPMCTIQIVWLTPGKNTPRNLQNATPTAAIVPVWMTRNSVQPYKNPQSGPKASRRYTYWPPALGIIAASSP